MGTASEATVEPASLTADVALAEQASPPRPLLTWLGIAFLLYLLLVAVALVGSGFKTAAGDQARTLFAFAADPLLGLLIGTLATALVQSSSTVTSIIVGLVAGGLPVSIAIPMVMGANIGTTITNTIVSLGHVGNRSEFRRAFSAATVHDFFNLLAVLVFLPLEILFGLLERGSHALATLLSGGESLAVGGFNFIKPLTQPVVLEVKGLFVAGGQSSLVIGSLMTLLGIFAILLAVLGLGRLLRAALVGRVRVYLRAALGRGPVTGIGAGAAVTVLVQSSSTTTSLMVPLAGSGALQTRDIYPFTLGANIGTCVTALLAATAAAGLEAFAAMQIAFAHLLFNVLGVALLYLLPHWAGWQSLSDFPVRASTWFANVAAGQRLLAFAYVFVVFFAFPGLLVMGLR